VVKKPIRFQKPYRFALTAFRLSLSKFLVMKKGVFYLLFVVLFTLLGVSLYAQCSICTRTAQQMGEKPARSLNTGILYLAASPLLIIGFIGYRWWKSNR